ncbi:MAG: hypothetical protein ACT4QF_22230 [Sporichthyaceae bacterium]
MHLRYATAVLLVGAALALAGCADSPDASPPPNLPVSPSVSPTLSASPQASAAGPTAAFCSSFGSALGESTLPAALLDLQSSGAEAVEELTAAAADTAAVLAGIARPSGLDPDVAARATDLQDALTEMADLGADDPASTLAGSAVTLTRAIGAFTDSCTAP